MEDRPGPVGGREEPLAHPLAPEVIVVQSRGMERWVAMELARLNGIRFEAAPAGAAMQVGAGDANIIVPLEGVIDIAAEQARLTKALAVSQKEAKSLEGRLSNPAFVEKAKPEAVDKARADLQSQRQQVNALAAELKRLDAQIAQFNQSLSFHFVVFCIFTIFAQIPSHGRARHHHTTVFKE